MSKELKILPVRKLNKKNPKHLKLHPVLPRPPCLIALIGNTNCGKSVWILNWVYRFYPKYFEQIYWISSTLLNDETTWAIRQDEKIIKITDGLDNLDEILMDIVAQQQEDKEEGKKVDDVLVILDDCLGYLRKGAIETLCSRMRHYKMTILVTTQNFMGMPPAMRYNVFHYVLFKLNSKKELSKVVQELEQLFPNFMEIYNEGLKKKYNFLFIDVKKQIIRENFGRILYEKKDDD